jgi:phosphoglycolate phosphatase
VSRASRLIAFDLDGTLVDSRRDLAESANQLVDELGGRPLSGEAVGAMVGEGAARLVGRALDAAGVGERPDALSRFLEIYDRRLLNHTRLYEGVADVVRRAAAHARLTVLTNKPTSPSERILEALGLREPFDEIMGGDGAYPRKPDPSGLGAMMAAAGARPGETMLVGDSGIDLETARRAGVHCCLVAYGFGFRVELLQQIGPDLRIAADMHELANVIADFSAVRATWAER